MNWLPLLALLLWSLAFKGQDYKAVRDRSSSPLNISNKRKLRSRGRSVGVKVKTRPTVSRLSTYRISVTWVNWLAIDYLDRHVGGNDRAKVLRLGLICVESDPISSDTTSHCQHKNCDPWNLRFIFLASNQRGFKTRIISKLCRFPSPPELKKKWAQTCENLELAQIKLFIASRY